MTQAFVGKYLTQAIRSCFAGGGRAPWTERRTVRRSAWRAAALICVGVAAGGAAQADEAGDALLKRCIAAETKAQTLQTVIQTRVAAEGKPDVITYYLVQMKKPNLLHATVNSLDGKATIVHRILNSDGKMLFSYVPSTKKVVKELPDRDGGNLWAPLGLEVGAFFKPEILSSLRAQAEGVSISGYRVIADVRCSILQIEGGHDVNILYIGPDNLLRGSEKQISPTNATVVLLAGMKSGLSFPPKTFDWQPPKQTH